MYVFIRFGKVPGELSYFYYDTYYCKIIQWKYLIRDYIIKKPYKEISFDGEFTPEIAFTLPFAYWHFKNGTLKKTISSKYTAELYFFSPQHEELFTSRTPEGNYNFETPRVLYSPDYNMKKWAQVPLKKIYQNDVYVFEKPILIIANRYNMEWDGPPISFFSIEILDFMISTLNEFYTIIYNRPRPENITGDNSAIYDLGEYEWLKETHPEVMLMEDLYQENKARVNNFNHLQLMVYANASRFISTHGGTAALASYFGGTNLILSKQGPEHYFGCYHKLYPQLSGATVMHAKTDPELIDYVNQYFIPEHPNQEV